MWSLPPPHPTSLPPFPPLLGKMKATARAVLQWSDEVVHSNLAGAHLTSVWRTLGRSGKRRNSWERETDRVRERLCSGQPVSMRALSATTAFVVFTATPTFRYSIARVCHNTIPTHSYLLQWPLTWTPRGSKHVTPVNSNSEFRSTACLS